MPPPTNTLSTEESDYLDNLRSRVGNISHVAARSPGRVFAKKPVIKLEVDLEKREVSVVGGKEPKQSPRSSKFAPRALLKRSLSQSARVLTNKANQLRTGDLLDFERQMKSPNVKVINFCI